MLAMAAGLISPIAAAGTDTTGPLQWTGEVVPGKENVTLTGNDIEVAIPMSH
jgi:hypothetical protein